ncbi:Vesicle transport V-snare protein [Mycoemilia scoparia]|uniref:Vesicle transport V-snare protein n=1 Tax=Mycoemilia scoparia TaxID=417184 RepID=A0A9W8A2G4_9FUNG|nr:Vesicle transport V-snare protein [Mycoemilia scoparia]
MSNLSRLEGYFEDLEGLIIEVDLQITKTLPTLSFGAKQKEIRSCQAKIEEIGEIIDQLETESSLEHNVKESDRARIREYKKQHQGLKEKLQNTVNNADGSSDGAVRRELFGDSHYSNSGEMEDAVNLDQRSRLLKGTERLEQSTQRLQDSHRIAMQTESVGIDILGHLRSQREQIQNTRNSLMQADENIDRSQRTLKVMARR